MVNVTNYFEVKRMNNKGVTLIELLIVIVVLGLISSFAAVQVIELVHNSRVDVDSFNLATLNEVTEDYADTQPDGYTDIFDGISDDEDRMNALVDSGYLSSTIKVQQSEAYFEWGVSSQRWTLIGGEINALYGGPSVAYDFQDETISELLNQGVVSINMSRWDTDSGYLENTTGESRIFIPINAAEYVIEVDAALGTGNSGGYGIFFDTTLRNDEVTKDDGYVFQFDRGYGSGAMIVRPRVNGSEKGAVWILRSQNTTVFPSKNSDPTWWTQSHTIKIIVTSLNSSTREAEFFIDGVSIGTFEYDNDVEGEKIYTGFRGWGSSTTQFYDISVQ